MSYTKEMTTAIVAAYTKDPSRETVEELAETYEKSIKSIIGKLSREGVYRRESYKTKTGEDPVTKLELVAEVANLLGVQDFMLAGLEKSPKAALKTIVAGLERGLNVRAGLERGRESLDD